MPLVRVDEQTKQFLDSLRTQYGTVGNAVKALTNPKPPYVLSLTKTCPASTWLTREDNYKLCPFTANVVSCNIFFPPGSQDLVLVKIGIGDESLSDWIQSGDGKSLSIPINKTVAKNTSIWAEMQNFDTTYPHTITCEVILAPIKGELL